MIVSVALNTHGILPKGCDMAGLSQNSQTGDEIWALFGPVFRAG